MCRSKKVQLNTTELNEIQESVKREEADLRHKQRCLHTAEKKKSATRNNVRKFEQTAVYGPVYFVIQKSTSVLSSDNKIMAEDFLST